DSSSPRARSRQCSLQDGLPLGAPEGVECRRQSVSSTTRGSLSQEERGKQLHSGGSPRNYAGEILWVEARQLCSGREQPEQLRAHCDPLSQVALRAPACRDRRFAPVRRAIIRLPGDRPAGTGPGSQTMSACAATPPAEPYDYRLTSTAQPTAWPLSALAAE